MTMMRRGSVSSLDPVYNYSDPGPVGFSEYADSETVSETIHLSSIFADNIHTCKYTIFSATAASPKGS